MKRISASNIVVTVIAVALAVSASVAPAYAAANPIIEAVLSELINMCITPDQANVDEDELVDAMNYARKVWRTSLDVRSEVDYDVLTSVYSQLIVQGVPCKIVISRGSAQGYYIKGTGDLPLCNGKGRYSIKGSYFSDTSGNIFYAALPDNGKTSTTVPSTSAPTVSEDTSTSSVPGASSDLSVLTPSNELQALKYINSTVTHIANEMHLMYNRLRDIERYVFRLYLNTGRFIDGINSIITGVYKQADLLTAYLPRLDDTVNRLSDIRAASWASVDVENRMLSVLTGINSQLDGVIHNGAVQVGSSSIEARLDKLISMYSKVNSVVLDTASVNGGNITGAVGGELQDVIFWGDTAKVNNAFISSDGVAYTLNDTPVDINGLTLRSVNLGSTIPSYIANDPVLYAGVWQKGTDYIISDTYNASTGEYVQRVSLSSVSAVSIILDAYGRFVLYIPDAPVVCAEVNFSRSSFSPNASVYTAAGDLVYMVIENLLYCIDRSCSDVNAFSSKYSDLSLLYPRGSAVVQYFDPSTIAIPEGSSYISSYNVRITGKYETYESFTQTADIITAINNLQLSSGVSTDLTAITTRLDTLINKTSDTVVNVVNNNTYITNVFQLDDETSVVDTTKDGVGKVSGLFKWLWNNTFKGAFSHADVTVLDGLFYDPTEVTTDGS